MSIIGYTYRAEIICPNCTIEALKSEYRAELFDTGADVPQIAEMLGYSFDELEFFDSNNFPKPFTVDQLDDNSQRCDSCRSELVN